MQSRLCRSHESSGRRPPSAGLRMRAQPLGDAQCLWLSAPPMWRLRGPPDEEPAVQLGQPGYNFFRDVHPATSPISQLWRHTVCLRSGAVSQRLLSPRAAEFPGINPAYTGAACTRRPGLPEAGGQAAPAAHPSSSTDVLPELHAASSICLCLGQCPAAGPSGLCPSLLCCAGQEHRYVYAALALGEAAVNGPQQALGRLDVATARTESWTRGRQYFVGEPCFVARCGGPPLGWTLLNAAPCVAWMCQQACKPACQHI